METLEALRNKIGSAEGLHSVVRTMKGLAAVNIRQYEKAVESLADYFRGVELGFQALLRDRPEGVRLRGADREPGGGVVAAVFGSDQGMCGQFNSRIMDHALAELDRAGAGREDRVILALGGRLAAALAAAGHEVADRFAVPKSVVSITARVQEVLLCLERHRAGREAARVVLFHNHPLTGAAYEPQTWQILPIDPEWLGALEVRDWPTRMLPLFLMDWQELLASLVRQYLFASLFRAFAASLVAENAARMASMQAAEKSIEDRLDGLRALFHRRRQSTITEELLDVMAGFEALAEQSGRRGY